MAHTDLTDSTDFALDSVKSHGCVGDGEKADLIH